MSELGGAATSLVICILPSSTKIRTFSKVAATKQQGITV
jgi:hypothetical protein